MSISKRCALLMTSVMLAACSKAPEPQQADPVANAPAALPQASSNVLRANLTAAGIRTEYAAQFQANQLERIDEHRVLEHATLAGAYEFKGARLLRYHGAKLTDPTQLELEFDLQGVLLSEKTPSIGAEDVRAIRNRAQLLRNHALAQRATKLHQ